MCAYARWDDTIRFLLTQGSEAVNELKTYPSRQRQADTDAVTSWLGRQRAQTRQQDLRFEGAQFATATTK